MPGHRPRLVLDTDVVVSSLWGGNPAKVVELWKEGAVSLLLSLPVLKEYLAVLARFGLDDAQLKERGLLFLESPFSVLVHPRRVLDVVREDPSLLPGSEHGKYDFSEAACFRIIGRRNSVTTRD